MTIARGLAAAVLAVGVVVGCSSGTNAGAGSSSRARPVAPPAVLDGTYSISYDYGAKTVNGKPTPTPRQQPDAWAVRSTCTDHGCVATRSVIKDGKPDWPMVFDFVDGRWVGMYRSPDHKCKTGGTAPYYRWFSLQPKPDGTFAGETYWMYFGTSCPQVTWLPFTLTRTGDAPPGLNDPAAIPPRTFSAPEGFHGRYSSKMDPVPGHDKQTPRITDLETMCVRDTDECATAETDTEKTDGYHTSVAYEFTAGHWIYGVEHDARCMVGGGTTRQTSVWELSLPHPVTNPFAKVTGTHTASNAGNCGRPPAVGIEYTRAGD